MRKKELRISEKNYNIVKNLSDRELGTLVKSLCEYVYYGKSDEPKDKVLKVYFNMFKEKIDADNFFRETGRLGGIKSNELKQKTAENRSVVLDIFKVDTLDELFKAILDSGMFCDKKCDEGN